MMPSFQMSVVFWKCNTFFELSFVFCGIIINQLLSQVNNIRFFNLTMVLTVEHKTFLISSRLFH
jgi:hypothetical protein